MKLITLIQAAALMALTVLGAYAAHGPREVTGADPSCLTDSSGVCGKTTAPS